MTTPDTWDDLTEDEHHAHLDHLLDTAEAHRDEARLP